MAISIKPTTNKVITRNVSIISEASPKLLTFTLSSSNNAEANGINIKQNTDDKIRFIPIDSIIFP